jgi:hypothetical protein
MKNIAAIRKDANSKGALIFRKMLEDKTAIQAHIRKGGRISDLKDKYSFAKPISIKGA